MPRFQRVIVLALAGLVGFGCSDTPSSPEGMGGPETTLPALVVSEALAGGSAGGASDPGSGSGVTYVSLPPGTLPNAVSVRIQNLTTGGSATQPIPIVEGGFDPVAVPARAGDRLELVFTGASGRVRLAHTTVPLRRPPVIVRTSPTKGRTDVPLDVVPTAIFSEPLDTGTLPAGIRLVRGGTVVSGRVETRPEEPWTAEFVPAAALEPATTYALEITPAVRDLDGDPLEAPLTVTFTTVPASFAASNVGRIAFVRRAQASGSGSGLGTPWIHVINPDGTGLERVAYGDAPAWSPDGQKIAFHTWPGGIAYEGATEIHVIDADGTDERVLGAGANPSWSPDGARIVFQSHAFGGCGGCGQGPSQGADILVMNADGSGVTMLLSREFANPGDEPTNYGVFLPTWAPDGRSIAFQCHDGWGAWDYGGGSCWPFASGVLMHYAGFIMNADGSDPRPLFPDGRTSFDGDFLGWSTHGLAFALRWWNGPGANRPGPGTIATVDAIGSPRRVHFQVPEGDHVGHPDWSPDGRHLVFERVVVSPGCPPCLMKIFVVSTEDGSVRPLIPGTPAGDSWDEQPVWSRAP